MALLFDGIVEVIKATVYIFIGALLAVLVTSCESWPIPGAVHIYPDRSMTSPLPPVQVYPPKGKTF